MSAQTETIIFCVDVAFCSTKPLFKNAAKMSLSAIDVVFKGLQLFAGLKHTMNRDCRFGLVVFGDFSFPQILLSSSRDFIVHLEESRGYTAFGSDNDVSETSDLKWMHLINTIADLAPAASSNLLRAIVLFGRQKPPIDAHDAVEKQPQNLSGKQLFIDFVTIASYEKNVREQWNDIEQFYNALKSKLCSTDGQYHFISGDLTKFLNAMAKLLAHPLQRQQAGGSKPFVLPDLFQMVPAETASTMAYGRQEELGVAVGVAEATRVEAAGWDNGGGASPPRHPPSANRSPPREQGGSRPSPQLSGSGTAGRGAQVWVPDDDPVPRVLLSKVSSLPSSPQPASETAATGVARTRSDQPLKDDKPHDASATAPSHATPSLNDYSSYNTRTAYQSYRNGSAPSQVNGQQGPDGASLAPTEASHRSHATSGHVGAMAGRSSSQLMDGRRAQVLDANAPSHDPKLGTRV